MAHWEVRTADRTAAVSGAHWLAAIGVATANLGLDSLSLARMVCDIRPDGLVQVRDPKSGLMLLVRHLTEQEFAAALAEAAPSPDDEPLFVVPPELEALEGAETAETEEGLPVPEVEAAPEDAVTEVEPPPTGMPSPLDAFGADTLGAVPAAAVADAEGLSEPAGAAVAEPDEDVTIADEEPDEDVTVAEEEPPPPHIFMPPPSGPTRIDEASARHGTLPRTTSFTDEDLAFFSQGTIVQGDEEEGAPDDIAERLFDRCFDISLADDMYDAARMALEILGEIVPAESGAVLFAGLNHTALEFLAATGPHAHEVKAMTVPFGQGIAGTVFDLGVSLIIRDATQDPRHLADVDLQTGYRTGPMLAAAVRDDEGTIHGAIELMNPPYKFSDWHLDAAVTVAAALADFIRTRA